MNRETIEAYVLATAGVAKGIGSLLLQEIKPKPKPEGKIAAFTYLGADDAVTDLQLEDPDIETNVTSEAHE